MKVSKKASIELSEKGELLDSGGLEVPYRKSFCGVSSIPLLNISVHGDLTHLVSNEKVCRIEQSIIDRYDPSQAGLSL